MFSGLWWILPIASQKVFILLKFVGCLGDTIFIVFRRFFYLDLVLNSIFFTGMIKTLQVDSPHSLRRWKCPILLFTINFLAKLNDLSILDLFSMLIKPFQKLIIWWRIRYIFSINQNSCFIIIAVTLFLFLNMWW